MAKQTDPVCGMQVEGQSAAGKSEHNGETYYFCSAGCKERFDQEPERYTKKAGGGE
jgi:Cu+-exporting ATPase